MPLTETQIANLNAILYNLDDLKGDDSIPDRTRTRAEAEGLLDGSIPIPDELRGLGKIAFFDYIERNGYEDADGNWKAR